MLDETNAYKPKRVNEMKWKEKRKNWQTQEEEETDTQHWNKRNYVKSHHIQNWIKCVCTVKWVIQSGMKRRSKNCRGNMKETLF